MWFVHGARDNLLHVSNIMKWTWPTLYKQLLTADQRILQRRSESKGYVRTDRLVEYIYHRTLIFGNNDCISLYCTFIEVNWGRPVQELG